MSHLEHRKQAPKSVSCAIITVSDTRTQATDMSGQAIRELLAGAGHTVCAAVIVKDEPAQIREELGNLAKNPACQCVLINGGTGISPRDRTYETISGLLEKRLEGFGELFRVLSFEEIGAAAMLSRAVAGVYMGRIVFSMPGSPNAVKLAMTRLILPELGHLVYELTKQ
jgi:molybdenum cofactor biosynthesis protein B